MKLRQFITDPQLGNMGAKSYLTWQVVAALLDGDGNGLSGEELDIAETITHRTRFPTQPFPDLYLLVGRKAGKTLFVGNINAYTCAQRYSNRMAPGEIAVAAAVAPTTDQASILFGYTAAVINGSPLLSAQVVNQNSTEIEFSSRTMFKVYAGNMRSTRGPTYARVSIDEASFLRSDEAANPDVELVRAVRPGLITLGGSLICFSSPYMRKGVMFDAHSKHFGQNDSQVLVIVGESLMFNPTLNASVIDQAYEDDSEGARSEWGGEFRSNLTLAIEYEWIKAAVESNVFERPRSLSTLLTNAPIQYVAFTDPAGGSGKDSWCTRIVHLDGKILFDDGALEIRPPFSTADAAERVATFLEGYGITSVTGDAYAGEWPADALKAHGIHYRRSEFNKSQIYLEVIPLFSSGRMRLLDHARTVSQLRQLERRTRSGGKDSVDHPSGGSDDNANALCGAAVMAARRPVSTEGQVKVFRSTVTDGLAGLGSDDMDPRRREYDGIKQPLWPDFN